VNERSPWLRLLAMAVLLAAFVATARGGARRAGPVDATSTVACELTPHDIDGR